MLDRFIGSRVPGKDVAPQKEAFQLSAEYNRCVTSLQRTGLVSLLTQPEHLGRVGINDANGTEYPIPTLEQVQHLFEANSELMRRKMAQGFTRLQLTPLALPISYLSERAKDVIRTHAANGKIFQTKRTPSDPDEPVHVDQDEPEWMWDALKEADAHGDLVYFPTSYKTNHQGMTKDRVLASQPDALRGWSVQLIEEDPFLPKEGQGKTQGGRKQLENNHTPQEYLRTLGNSGYEGETGWTIEDFLTHFLTRLAETNQVSNDWDDYNALWLTGNYHSPTGLVPGGDWRRSYGGLDLAGNNPDGRRDGWGARSTVRLS